MSADVLIANPRRSVLQDWVMELPLREQGTLLTAVRGCDLTPKHPLDSLERRLVAAIRCSFMVPADEREVDSEPGCFMSREIPVGFKPSALGHYPQHWIAHVMHAAEVLAYRHPDQQIAVQWHFVYETFCHSFHVPAESPEAFEARMSEDRIASGEIVS
jgi:hypothetical protein